MSGFLAITPKPEQGTSQSTRSNVGQSELCCVASFSTATAQVMPQRSNACCKSGTRAGTNSPLTSWPLSCMASANVRLLPPGAAQRSSTCCPGCASTQSAANWLASPCTWKSPFLNAALAAGEPANSTTSAPGQGPGVTVWPSCCKSAVRAVSFMRSVLTRIVVLGFS